MSRVQFAALVAASLVVPTHALAQTPEQVAEAVRLARRTPMVEPVGQNMFASRFTATEVTRVYSVSPYQNALKILEAQGIKPDPLVQAMVLKEVNDQQNQDMFKGFKVGFGMAYTASPSRDRVKEAAVVNGIVRVTKENNDTTRALAEVHYFFTPDHNLLGLPDVSKGKWGIGPFVAADISGGGVGGLGFGLMLGLKQPENSAFTIPIPGQSGASHSSWNIGAGAFVDPVVKVLGDGIVENRPLPAGEATNVRTKEVSRWGWLLMTSFSF